MFDCCAKGLPLVGGDMGSGGSEDIIVRAGGRGELRGVGEPE